MLSNVDRSCQSVSCLYSDSIMLNELKKKCKHKMDKNVLPQYPCSTAGVSQPPCPETEATTPTTIPNGAHSVSFRLLPFCLHLLRCFRITPFWGPSHSAALAKIGSQRNQNSSVLWSTEHDARKLKVSRGNSEYRVILNTSRTMLCYFSSINSCTLVLHLQVGLEGSLDRSISCHCRSSLHIVRLQMSSQLKIS